LESLEAQLLLHVVDASDQNVEHKIKVVEDILAGLLAGQPTILVLNKSDLLTQSQKDDLLTRLTNTTLSEHIYEIQFVSSTTNEGISELKDNITEFFAK
jgi:GTPase